MKERNGATRQKGFTLIELLVVMAVLGVLAAMVMPTVTGVKTGGETASGKSDAKSVEDAINNFNTNSRTQGFPEDAITASGNDWVINGKNVASSLITAQISDLTISNTTQISWTAQALVRQKDGTMITQTFVPDFIGSTPKAASWVRGSSSASSPDEFLWLLKKGTTGDNVGRTFIVLRLNQAGDGYDVIRK